MQFQFSLPAALVVRPTCRRDGENVRLLMASVIRRAAYDIALYRGSRKLDEQRLATSAYNWMFRGLPQSEDPMDRFMSFINLCEVLGTDPEWVRNSTLRMSRADVQKYDRIPR